MRCIRKIILLIFIPLSAGANQNIGLNDYGVFIDSSNFKQHCRLLDEGLSGKDTFEIYSNEKINCNRIQNIYNETYFQILNFLSVNNYSINKTIPYNIVIRILTISQLNNPNNFAGTESACMRGFVKDCKDGVFVGRTFYGKNSSNINIYVTDNNLGSRYSFFPTIKHELMHAILYIYGLHSFLSEKEEHMLISKFLDSINVPK